ncbi:hypothetical protein CC79DRAFT_577629 [Sarocladium strictum]
MQMYVTSPPSRNKMSLTLQESQSPISSTEPLGHEMQRSLSVRLDEPAPSFRNNPTEHIDDLCSVINADATIQTVMGSLGIMGQAKQYDVQVIDHDPDGSADSRIMTLSDLIRVDRQGLTRRQRMQIAFQLCLSVLQLYRTHWIGDGWSWEESCALRLIEEQPSDDNADVDEYEKREFPHLFITQKFYSHNQQPESPTTKVSHTASPLSILANNPKLAKLGFALIVLAVNKTLAEIRQEKAFADVILHGHEDLDNFITARKLLKTSRIREEAGVAYEEVVKACIEGRYMNLQDATKEFGKTDVDEFYDDAEEAIMHPLFTYCQVFA